MGLVRKLLLRVWEAAPRIVTICANVGRRSGVGARKKFARTLAGLDKIF